MSSIPFVAFSQTDSLNFNHASWEMDTLQTGLIHYYHHFTTDSIFQSPQNINFLKISKSLAKKSLKVLRADTVKTTTSELSRSMGALAAVNGSFFNVKTGESVNFIKVDGSILDTTVYDAAQKKLKVNQNGILAFGAEGLEILRRKWGESSVWPDGSGFASAMEAGPLLVMDGQAEMLADTPFNKNRHPRTCVCLTEDDLILLTADGRNAQAYGLNLDELSLILKWLGCKSALNLDGGGSTTMYLSERGVVNMPSDNKLFDHEGERSVSNALGLMPDKP